MLFTVFTPTYNRAHTLSRLHASLEAQSERDFEWLVVDDGSTDVTATLMARLADAASFPVRYIQQENGGKHVATNRGVREAAGDLFLTLDSDDWALPHALERFRHEWHSIPEGARPRFAAVTALCQNPEGVVLGEHLPAAVLDSNSLELRYRYKVAGDKWGFTRTAVMRQFPFPEGEYDYVPEGIVWNAIAGQYKTRYINEALLVKDYQADGFTEGGRVVGPEGMALYYGQLLSVGARYLMRSPRDLFLAGGYYSWWSTIAGFSIRKQVRELRGAVAKTVWLATLLWGREKARRQRLNERRMAAASYPT